MHYLQDFHNFQNFYFNTFMKYCFKWALTTDIYQPISDLLYVTVSNWGVCCQICQFLSTMGIHLPSIYMHCPRSSSGCSGMQGLCAQLMGGSSAFGIYMSLNI